MAGVLSVVRQYQMALPQHAANTNAVAIPLLNQTGIERPTSTVDEVIGMASDIVDRCLLTRNQRGATSRLVTVSSSRLAVDNQRRVAAGDGIGTMFWTNSLVTHPRDGHTVDVAMRRGLDNASAVGGFVAETDQCSSHE